MISAILWRLSAFSSAGVDFAVLFENSNVKLKISRVPYGVAHSPGCVIKATVKCKLFIANFLQKRVLAKPGNGYPGNGLTNDMAEPV